MVKQNVCSDLKRAFLNILIRITLKCHNLFYGLAGYLAQHLEATGLHPKHRLLDYHRWFMDNIESGWSVLDVGCGNGALTRDLAKRCKKVVGIDISPVNIAKAKEISQADFICADATAHKFNGKFDCVVLSNVLEHIKDRVAFLQDLKKHSNRFLIRVPMLDRDWITLYKKEAGIEYRLDPTHYTEYTFQGLTDELGAVGLKIESSRIRYGEIYAVAVSKELC